MNNELMDLLFKAVIPILAAAWLIYTLIMALRTGAIDLSFILRGSKPFLSDPVCNRKTDPAAFWIVMVLLSAALIYAVVSGFWPIVTSLHHYYEHRVN